MVPRLDVWLVEEGHCSSRQVAKRAIKSGLVLVNGEIRKSSYQVKSHDTVELVESVDNPMGFSKLQKIDELLDGKLIPKNARALDIGSSAGGFLLYLAENGIQEAIGLEVADRFYENLVEIAEQYPFISIIIDDAFVLEPEIIAPASSLDILLIDVTTDPNGTQTLVKRFSPLLKTAGILVSAFKSSSSSGVINEMKLMLQEIGYRNLEAFVLDPTRQEFHIIGYRT